MMVSSRWCPGCLSEVDRRGREGVRAPGASDRCGKVVGRDVLLRLTARRVPIDSVPAVTVRGVSASRNRRDVAERRHGVG